MNLDYTDHRQICSEASFTPIIQSALETHKQQQRLICGGRPSVEVTSDDTRQKQ